MPRTKNSKNCSSYKYKVIDQGEVKYYVSQKNIQEEYDMVRTAVYFMIHSPDRITHKKNIIIQKLDEPLPVYEIKKVFEGDDLIVTYEKIIY